MSKIPPGLQLYTVRSELEKDFLGTLRKVADIGYKIVEFAQFATDYGGIPASEMKRVLAALGLETVSTFVREKDLENDLQNQLDYAETIGARYIIASYPPEKVIDEVERKPIIASLKRIGREVNKRGMQFLYHPHAEEFAIKDGKRILDRLLSDVGTDLMKLNIDLHWAKTGGLDPKEALLIYKDLSPIIHVKDMDPKGNETEVGRGIIDWPPIFRILKDAGVKYYFVEQDYSPHPLKSVKMSFDYLKSIGVT